MTLRGVGILICHYNNSLCVNPTGFYSPNILYLLSSFSNPPTDFSSCQQAELQKLNKAYLWPRSKIWITAATKVTNMLYLASGVRLPCSLTNQNLFGSVSFACGKSEFRYLKAKGFLTCLCQYFYRFFRISPNSSFSR